MAINLIQKSQNIPDYPIWRLSLEQYHHMIQSGILTEDDPVELLEGLLITKMPKNPAHTLANQLTHDALDELLPDGWFVNAQEPITTADSEPEPDVIVVKGKRRDYYLDRHPYPDDVALIVEVSDATLARDRTLKQRIYAAARIPIYWILNLPDQQLEVYSNPSGDGDAAKYDDAMIYAKSEDVSVRIAGDQVGSLTVGELLS